MGPNRRARLLCALDDKPCTVFKCSPTEDPQVCLSGNHRPQRRPTGKNPLWRPKNAVKLIFRLLVERRRPQVAFPHGTEPASAGTGAGSCKSRRGGEAEAERKASANPFHRLGTEIPTCAFFPLENTIGHVEKGTWSSITSRRKFSSLRPSC